MTITNNNITIPTIHPSTTTNESTTTPAPPTPPS
eukprot:CAMPEP_0183713638 /NCGR_PEP_ID=MMETSP0737-20130205/8433_1 /TAXON_ID=385413 /ORGANISM="Thalassiosira miniscula, Strain CCMP1093" /LENGTH=33 /DNA_ID= /DNA_START= /DNA_END= /DNA_ORIENTATION=